MTTARGWRRPVAGTDTERAELLALAIDLGEQTERARQQMLELAARRQDAVLDLYDRGVSVRELAAQLGVSAGVVQEHLRQARRRRGS